MKDSIRGELAELGKINSLGYFIEKTTKIEDLGKTFNISEHVLADKEEEGAYLAVWNRQGDELDIPTGCRPLLEKVAAQDPMGIEYMTEFFHQYLRDCIPAVSGDDPHVYGRKLITLTCPPGVVFDETDSLRYGCMFFGYVSVDARVAEQHLPDAEYLEWWLKHSTAFK